MNDYLSIAEASAYSGKAKTTLRNAIRRGTLASVRIVGKIAIKRSDLDLYCQGAKPGRPRKDSHTSTSEGTDSDHKGSEPDAGTGHEAGRDRSETEQ